LAAGHNLRTSQLAGGPAFLAVTHLCLGVPMRLRPVAHLVLLVAVTTAILACMAGMAHGAEGDAAKAAATATAAPGAAEPVTVSIDWLAEIAKGGFTALIQVLLVIGGTAFAIERFKNLRRRNIAPHGLTEEVKALWDKDDHDGIVARCEKDGSTLARVVEYMVRHRKADYQTLMQGAADIGARDLKKHNQKAYPLAIVSTLEPLLGLLGTMIGMIEAFAKVAAFGDTGDAGMLADAIGKALITTALGLIIAIPALALYHWFKQRTSLLGTELEEEIDEIASSWFIAAGDEAVSSHAVAAAPVSAHGAAPSRSQTVGA
jgi:biopolymer transport protein ExbB